MTALPVFLSSGCVPRVKINDRVKASQLIAQKIVCKQCAINISDEFNESHEKARKYILKRPGDKVKMGDVLAVKKNFLGFREKKVVSRVEGIFSRYERDSGNLVIELAADAHTLDIVSPVDGIISLCNNDKIAIETDKDVFSGRKGGGGSGQGEVFVLAGAFPKSGSVKSDSEISLYYSLDSNAIGKIIVGRNFSRDMLIKSIGMGVAGVIGTEIRGEDIEYISGRHMQVPLVEVDNDIIEKIIQWKGKKIYLNSSEKVLILLHA